MISEPLEHRTRTVCRAPSRLRGEIARDLAEMGHSASRTSMTSQAWLTRGHRSQLSAYPEAREVSELPCRGVSQDGGEFEPGSGLLSLPGLAREHLRTSRSLSVGFERPAGLWTETGAYERWSSAPRISRARSLLRTYRTPSRYRTRQPLGHSRRGDSGNGTLCSASPSHFPASSPIRRAGPQ